MISPEQNSCCLQLVRRWLTDLNPQQIDPEQIVWHYTKGDALVAMIKSGLLYTTQVSCLNDSTEIRYAIGLLRKCLTELLPRFSNSTSESKFVKKYISALDDSDDLPNHAPSPFFVGCFSELEDDLGMWRSYSGGESGYAIGVRIGHLLGNEHSLVRRVNYDKVTHERIAKEVAAETVRLYSQFRGEQSGHGEENFDEEFMAYWDGLIATLAPFVKDPGFSAEKEVRIAREWQGQDLPNLVFLQRKTLLARHLPFAFPVAFPVGHSETTKFFPISDLIVGPGRHKHISLVSVNTLLRQCGYPPQLHCRRSSLPYQDV